MEEKKKKILLIVVVIFVLALVAAIYLFYFHDSTSQKQDTNGQPNLDNQPSLPSNQGSNQGNNELPENIEYSPEDNNFREKESLGRNDFKKLASSFVERFGSYSSHSGLSNIKDLKLFMSSDMKKWANDFIEEELSEKDESDNYYGISTRAIVSKISEFDENNKVVVTVQTQRTEVKDDQEKVFNQNIDVTLTKDNKEWKVSRAEWQ